MHTKIVATIGPSCFKKDILNSMVQHGVRIFRFNFSHANAKSFIPIVEIIRQIEVEQKIPLTIMADLCGPKIRIGAVENSPREISKDEIIYLGTPEQKSKVPTNHIFISVAGANILDGLSENMPVSLSDGALQFLVTKILEKNKLFTITASNAGIITSNKGITFPGKAHLVSALTDKDRVDLREAIDIGVDAFAISFVQQAKDITDAKQAISSCGVNLPVIAKIERQSAIDNLNEILTVADGIMFARGDLGLECPPEQLPVMQKKVLLACRHARKPVIVATQMLLSMVKNSLPTRAETSDVANAILDGTDCIMLSEETAIGSYPAETVAFMEKIAKATEPYYLERLGGPYIPNRHEHNTSKYIAYSACLIATNSESKAIVAHTTSGNSAWLLSSRRPEQIIYALTGKEKIVRGLNFYWGINPRLANLELKDHLQRLEYFINQNSKFQPGDTITITAGRKTKGDKQLMTNMIHVYCK